MKELFKRAYRNKGMSKQRAKSQLFKILFAVGMLIAIGTFATGAIIESDMNMEHIAGAVGGSVLFAIPVLAFPKEIEEKMSDDEKKAWNTVASALALEINNAVNTAIEKGAPDVVGEAKKALHEQFKEYGVSAEQIGKWNAVIEDHAKQLKALAETKGERNHMAGKEDQIKKSFFEKLPDMLKDYERGKDSRINNSSITIKERVSEAIATKAIDEHNPNLIITTDNVTTAGTTGFDWLVDYYNSFGQLIRKRRPIEYIRRMLNVTRVARVPEVFTWYEEGDESGAFAVVAENALKPQIGLEVQKYYTNAQKAAGYIVVTEEVLKWRDVAWGYIQTLFREKLERDYNRILNTELIANAIAYPGTPLDGTIADPNDIDAIAAAALASELMNFQPDTIIINPADKWRLLLTTNNNGSYIFLPFVNSGDEPQLFGYNLVTSNYVPVGTFYLGQSGTWNLLEEAPTVRTGWVNDDFIHNRMTIIAEVYFLSWIPAANDGAWIAGSFDDIKDALQV